MEQKRHLEKLHGMIQFLVYAMVFLEIFLFFYSHKALDNPAVGNSLLPILDKLMNLPIYQNLVYSKLSILLAICLASIGTLSKKELNLNPKTKIMIPLMMGFGLFFGSLFFYSMEDSSLVLPHTSWADLAFCVCSLVGAVLIHTSLDNVSKLIRSGLGKDEWNIEGESFMQEKNKTETPYSVNIPMRFYYKKRIHKGWINIVNPFRGTLLIGTPGSGKSYSVVNPFIRQMIAKGYTKCLYDKEQLGESVSIDRVKTSVSLNEKYDPLIPAGKIAGMQTGELVGLLAVDADKFYGTYKTAYIHRRVNLDPRELKREERNYRPIPKCYAIKGKKEHVLTRNFMRIREEVEHIIGYFTASA